MCPSCGLPEAEVRKHMPPPPPPEPKQEPTQAPVKTDDAPYKTTASKLLAAFAWLTWAGGVIGVIAIAVAASQIHYSYYSYYADHTTGNIYAFLALAVGTSSLVFGALLYGASKLLVDIHAARMNLEQLNAKKEG